MRLHNIVTQTQSQASSLPRRFGGEEACPDEPVGRGLKDFVYNFLRDAVDLKQKKEFRAVGSNNFVTTDFNPWDKIYKNILLIVLYFKSFNKPKYSSLKDCFL